MIHWLIDNGHGGINPKTCQPVTPGKRSPVFPVESPFGGEILIEGVRNRAVANYLTLLLKENGSRFTLLVPTWEDVSLSDRVVLANMIARKEKKEGVQSIYLSIHHDAFGKDWNDANGCSAFHYPGSIIGQQYAEIFEEEIHETTGFRSRGVKDAEFYVLRKTNCPAILTESGFMTNLKNATFAQSEEGSKAIAKGHFEAIKKIERINKIKNT